MTVDSLHQLARTWDATTFKLWPDLLLADIDLECTGREKHGLNRIRKHEEHQTSGQLVRQHPSINTRCIHSQISEWVAFHNNCNDETDFSETKKLKMLINEWKNYRIYLSNQSFDWTRRIVCTFNLDSWILVVNDLWVLFESISVAARNTEKWKINYV